MQSNLVDVATGTASKMIVWRCFLEVCQYLKISEKFQILFRSDKNQALKLSLLIIIFRKGFTIKYIIIFIPGGRGGGGV